MTPAPIHGTVSAGFEPVREAFAGNFTARHELGGACCIYVQGEKVVDLWGGVRSAATGEPWEADTMVLVHSATKGFAAMTLALAHSRGWLDYDERVCAYWPEFAQQGKELMTVRQLLAHQGGLFAFGEPVDKDVVADLDRLAIVLARQRPEWPPGGGVGTARAMARAYSVFATDGHELGLRAGTLALLAAPAIPSAHGFYDEGVKGDMEYALGFMKTCANWRFGHAGAFGAPGAGGALAFADPQTGMAYAYVTNRMGGITGDRRDLALRRALPPALQ